MDIAFDIEVHFYTKIITFLSDLWSLFCIIWLFNGLSVPGGSIWTSSWGYWPIPINSKFVDLLLDIQQKLITNKEKNPYFLLRKDSQNYILFWRVCKKKYLAACQLHKGYRAPPPSPHFCIAKLKSYTVILWKHNDLLLIVLNENSLIKIM